MSYEINDNTRIGLYAAVGTLPIIVGMVFFIATIYYKASASETRLDRQAESIREQRLMLIEIKERTARIEGLISVLANKK